MKKIVAATTLGLAAVATVLTDVNPQPAQAVAAQGTQLRVASFNIISVSNDKTAGNQRPWKLRRGKVVSQILGERVDVLGLQEASPHKSARPRLVTGMNQFRDVQIGLNRAGRSYKITNPYPYNCVNDSTLWKCQYKDRGAAGGTRILYNSQKLALVSQGAVPFSVQGAGVDERHIVWAVLRIRATGEEFLFVNTHLRAGDSNVRRAQWNQLIRQVNYLKNGRPVIVAGDFNTQKFDPLTKSMLPAMRNAGYGDVLNQSYAVNPVSRPRAERRINGWLNSWNRLDRNVRNTGYFQARNKTGNNIDWIFASNNLRVNEWKTVADFNPRTLRINGVFPSDHHMVRATLTIP